MREIKFRAWDKKRNRFHWGVGNLLLALSGHLMWQFGFDAPTVLSHEEQTDYVLQQFTGLHDNNRKEIYEGDIVRQVHLTDVGGKQYFLYHIIEWSPKFSGWWMRNVHAKDDKDGCIQLWVHQYPLEIIGNVYENPKLLEGK